MFGKTPIFSPFSNPSRLCSFEYTRPNEKKTLSTLADCTSMYTLQCTVYTPHTLCTQMKLRAVLCGTIDLLFEFVSDFIVISIMIFIMIFIVIFIMIFIVDLNHDLNHDLNR